MSIGIRKFKKTKVGSIPEDWQVVKIINLAKTSSGGTPSRNNKEYFKGTTPWVKTGELTNKYLQKTEECISKLAIKNSSAKVFPKGTILVAMYGATIGKMSILNIDASCNQACCTIIPDKSKASTEYVYYALEYRKPLLISMGSGGAQPNISQQIIKVFEIPFPEIVEQEKIAEILSTVDADIEKTDAIIKETQQLKKGLMQKLFTEGIGHIRFKKTKIGRIPEEWQTAKLKEVAVFNNGANFSKHEVDDKGILMADVLNMYNEDILIDTSNFYRVKKKFSKNFILEKGDILFVRSSLKREGVGLSALFDGHHEPVVFCGFLIKAKLTNSNISPKFLSYYLRAPQTRNKIISLSGTVAITNINQESLGLLNVPIPSMNEQLKITNIFSELNAKIENEQNYKLELEQLKKGFLQVLLTGQVRVKV